MVISVIVFVIAAGCSATLTPWVSRLGARAGFVDRPADRKVHTSAIPRVGGVAVAVSLALTLGLWLLASRVAPGVPGPSGLLSVLVGALMVFAVGLRDDLHVPPHPRRIAVSAPPTG